MPKKQNWVVRIVLNENESVKWGILVECLRYAGTLSRVNLNGTTDEDKVWDLHCPYKGSSIQTDVWAKQNADRMRSFGMNATAAPVSR
jgi:hypothetical protein